MKKYESRLESINDHLSQGIQKLAVENEILRKGLRAVEALISDSHGVSGLHLNGDVAPWDELRMDGAYSDWLADFDTAMDLIDGVPAEGE